MLLPGVGFDVVPTDCLALHLKQRLPGANGKSKLLQTLQHLVGQASVMNAPIANFQRDRFNVAALQGKLLFIDDDIGADTHLDDGLLKAISEAKEMSARHAYGERHFKFRCLALPVMAGNHYPTTSDNSHGCGGARW